VLNGNKDAVAVLLEHKADPNFRYSSDSAATPLHQAAQQGVVEIAELLLDKGAKVDARDKYGKTPLHWAVGSRQLEAARLLLEHKADPNAMDVSGATPLDYAKGNTVRTAAMPRAVPGPPGIAPISGWASRPPGAANQSEPAPLSTIAETLRKAGALDEVPRLDRIEVRRPSAGYANSTSTQSGEITNQFTLLEMVGIQYALVAWSPYNDPPQRSDYNSLKMNGFKDTLAFPALAGIRLRRPTDDRKQWRELRADLTPILEAGDCAKDILLRGGDVIEIPEQDHPLARSRS
jgi:hypothetical protein